MPQNVRPLPPELTQAIADLGDRVLVLVEGKDDQAVFEELFLDRLDRIAFHKAGGKEEVENLLTDITQQRQDVTAFGICDRDFADASEVERRLQDPDERLFMLTWFSIENYLLDPEAVWDVLRLWFHRIPPIANLVDAEAFLLEACHGLRSVLAADWLLTERQAPKLGVQEHWQRDRVIEKIQYGLGCQKPEAETLLAEKEAAIDAALTNLQEAYTRIDGKHLIQRIFLYTRDHKNAMPPERIFTATLDWLKKNRPDPHPHLTEIVDGKILASKQNSA